MAFQAVVHDDCVALALRPSAGRYFHCRICVGSMRVDALTVSEYLAFKEKLASESLQSHTLLLCSDSRQNNGYISVLQLTCSAVTSPCESTSLLIFYHG